jgi:hypothetical protein
MSKRTFVRESVQEEARMQDRVDDYGRFVPEVGLRRAGRGACSRGAATLALATLLALTAASPGQADEYDSANAGHPVRIVAYVLHPVGVLLDYLLLRPAHWIVSQEPMSTIFGHED